MKLGAFKLTERERLRENVINIYLFGLAALSF